MFRGSPLRKSGMSQLETIIAPKHLIYLYYNPFT
jgi:hypothetical protein